MINEKVKGLVIIVGGLVIGILIFYYSINEDIFLALGSIPIIVLCLIAIIMVFKPKTKEEMITKMSVKDQVHDLGKKRVGLLVFLVGMLVINIVLLYHYTVQDFSAIFLVGSSAVIGGSIYGIIKMFKPNFPRRFKQ